SGKTYASTGSRAVIGKDPTAQLVLTDRTVSHFHCEIGVARDGDGGVGGGVAILRDLGSRNGTLLDGVPVLSAPLRKAALLTLGRTQVRFETGTERVREPVSSKE